MNTMKRIFAFVLVLVLAMGLTTIAWAEEPHYGSIEINAAENTVMTGRTFEFYKIFTAVTDGDAVSYEWVEKNPEATTDAEKYYFYDFFFAAPEGGSARIDEATAGINKIASVLKYIRTTINDSAVKAAQLATDLENYIEGLSADEKAALKATPSVVTTAVKNTYGDLPYGYYLIKETTTGADTPVSAIMVDTAAPNASITLKVIQPTIEKTVVGVSHAVATSTTPVTIFAGTSGAGVQGISAQIGDTIEYCVDLSVPDISTALNARGFYWYHFQEQKSDAVLEIEDESGYELKLVKKDTGDIVTLQRNIDYVILPKTYAELKALVASTAPADQADRLICMQLIVYIFDQERELGPVADIGNLTVDQMETFVGKVLSAEGPLGTEAEYNSFTNNGGGIVFRLATGNGKFAHGDTIKVFIEATVKDTKSATASYVGNNASLRYTKDPTKPTTDSNIGHIDDDAKVYTHKLDITKIAQDQVNGEDIKLTGAVFTVDRVIKTGEETEIVMPVSFTKLANGQYKVSLDNATGSVSEIEVDNNGLLDIAGLAAGTYRLTEVEAPVGYNIPENPFDFTITDSYNSVSGLLENLAGTASGEDAATGARITKIVAKYDDNLITACLTNQKGGQLPATGSTSALMFTLVGGTMAVAMFAFLVIELNKNKKYQK